MTIQVDPTCMACVEQRFHCRCLPYLASEFCRVQWRLCPEAAAYVEAAVVQHFMRISNCECSQYTAEIATVELVHMPTRSPHQNSNKLAVGPLQRCKCPRRNGELLHTKLRCLPLGRAGQSRKQLAV
eukprot:gnl/TRDRNA2_/TRDRNA2_171482_c17_seq1.p1 gnl/TRDRNA2_/TRDRNA2_171482_c17~~gnl/TRDRNA2_/TRDRNA2_171482_c17_seq1.p1  ORF type:complete len:127 (-),score=10.85 gnl/TRDRNA2_/TRDRNA2_171482_c17_seq1:602-982(-)